MGDARFDAAALQGRTAQTMFGVVSAVDPVNHAVKVRIQPEDIETGWLPDAALAHAGDLRICCPTAPGAHVVLQPLEGDAEQLVVCSSVFDTVVQVPISPLTGIVAQPGEFLVRAGCGTPPITASGSVGAVSASGGWLHLGADTLAIGAGSAKIVLMDGEIMFSVGSVSMRLTTSGLSVSGGDIATDHHSLDRHIHIVGNEKSEGPTG